MSNNSILECVQKSSKYEIALFTTYNFEIPFFERFIKNALFSKKIKKISVFVDSQELNKAIAKEGDVYNIGHHYVVNPIEMNGSFHPKVVLLLGKNKAKVFVSSCNLTTNGYTINNEAFYSFECDNTTGQHKTLILDVIDFFCRLNELSYHADDDLFNEVRGFRSVYESFPDGDSEARFIHNLDTSIFEQIQEVIDTANNIDIAVPYYDNSCNALKTIASFYNTANIKLFLQNNQARIPIKELNSLSSVSAFPFAGFGDRKNNNNFYHGKVFRFQSDTASYTVFGSANCTSSAIIRSFSQGGNIEAVVIYKNDNEESNDFFNNFIECNNEEPSYELIRYESTSTNNFFFRNGMLRDKLYLILGVTRLPSAFKVFIDKDECNYVVSNNDIEVSIELESLTSRNTINLDIEYDDKFERIICWYNNPSDILYTRIPSASKHSLDDVTLDPDNDKYIKDQQRISEALALNLDSYMSDIYNSRRMQRNQDSLVDDEEEYDDGIIDFKVPEDKDYEFHKRQIKKLNSIKQHYYDRYFKLFLNHSHIINQPTDPNNSPVSKKRKPTKAETDFKRFIRKRLNGFIDDELVKVVSFEHYIACTSMFFSFFDLYTIEKHVEGLFDDKETAEKRLSIVKNLVILANNDADKNEIVLFLFLKVLLINRFYVNASWDEYINLISQSKSILYSFENANKTSFRETAEELIALIAEDELHCDAVASKNLLDELYGYLPLKRINEIITHEFSKEIDVGVSDSVPRTAKIKVMAKSLAKYINYSDSRSIKALIDYNKHKKRWDKIILDVRLSPDFYNPKAPDPLVQIISEYDFTRKTRRVNYKHKSGSFDPEKRSNLL